MINKNSIIFQSMPEKASAQFLMLFTMLYVTFNLVGCALLFKVVKIGPGVAPGGIFFLPLVLLIEDIVAEIYGYKISRALLWYILMSSLIFSICTVLVVKLPSPEYWHFDSAYHTVFDPLLRGGFSLFIAVLVGRFINIYALTKTKILVRGKYFWIRSVVSTSVGGFVALALLCTLAYSNSVPLADIEKLFVTDYIKKNYGIDTYDYDTNFNPFKISLAD
jgi:uncharacterized integral membrane protein (TIGR00697 family)